MAGAAVFIKKSIKFFYIVDNKKTVKHKNRVKKTFMVSKGLEISGP